MTGGKNTTRLSRSFLYGILSALAAWATLMLADAIDEYILRQESLLGAAVFFILPIAMLVIYIRHYRKNIPSWKNLILWFVGYCLAYIPTWIVIFDCVNKRRFFIEQHQASGILDLNGIEYMFYGCSTLIAFVALCIIYHVIRLIISLFKKS
ncbi:hypothetical protein SAMN02910369_01350 [Lachnospiraceae bacterium NE2001]|nr:hypothetical protein SAMN02910369_01350 [Lachnospiraceae bacterium NE2001]